MVFICGVSMGSEGTLGSMCPSLSGHEGTMVPKRTIRGASAK